MHPYSSLLLCLYELDWSSNKYPIKVFSLSRMTITITKGNYTISFSTYYLKLNYIILFFCHNNQNNLNVSAPAINLTFNKKSSEEIQ